MKKSVSIVMILLLMSISSVSSFAGIDDLLFTFSTKGPDRYSDGTAVKDGERYALVWAAEGHQFEGFRRNMQLIDPENNRAVVVVSAAKKSRCPPILVQIAAAYAEKLKEGRFSVVLLDTRIRHIDGTQTLSSSDSKQLPKAVASSASVIDEVNISSSFATVSSVSTNEPQHIIAASADSDLLKIAHFSINDDEVTLKISQVKEFNQYNIYAGESATDISRAAFQYDFNGEPDENGEMLVRFRRDKTVNS